MPDRTVIAISDDQRWYTVLDWQPRRLGSSRYFTVYWWSDFQRAYVCVERVQDAGQDANNVLTQYIAENGDGA